MKVIIQKIVVTEKSSKSLESGKYVFDVNTDANKNEVKVFVENHFKVKVKDVNILNRKGKRKQKGRSVIQLKDKKRALVTLFPGEVIEQVKGQF